jgi:hypothetical protein
MIPDSAPPTAQVGLDSTGKQAILASFEGHDMPKRIAAGVMAAAIVLSVGCGGPPKEEINRAEAARASADAAKANIYVKDTYGLAAMAWNDGQAAVRAKEWDKARKAYAAAARQFEEAAEAAPSGHDGMKKELTGRMDEMLENHMKMIKDMPAAIRNMKEGDKTKIGKLMVSCQTTMGAAIEALDKNDLVAAKEKMDADDSIHMDIMAIMKAKI